MALAHPLEAPRSMPANFDDEVKARIETLAGAHTLKALSNAWMLHSGELKWSYNFSWLGRPAIQFPNDAWAMQELVWRVRPDLIIESGIAHGGSLVFYAHMLATLDLCEAVEQGAPFDPRHSRRQVLGLDIDIRAHNREAIERHPMAGWIRMIEGSSVAPETIAQVHAIAAGHQRVLVSLDSNHCHDHVLAELEAYAPLVGPGSYCVVFDTILEDMPAALCVDRPWAPGNSPKTAVREFLKTHPEFEIDRSLSDKLQITVAPEGFLRRVGVAGPPPQMNGS